jgi:hypothetical protein
MTEAELHLGGRRLKEDVARREALLHAERAAGGAASAVPDVAPAPEAVAHFEAQMHAIADHLGAMPSEDMLTAEGRAHDIETRQLTGMLHDAEVTELRLEDAGRQQ